jgi:outer membrane immunogenic protein
MKSSLSLAAIAFGTALAAAPAFAADLPTIKGPPPVFVAPMSWTGFYTGLNVGYGFASDPGYTQSLRLPFDGTAFNPNAEVFRLQGARFDGILGGVQVGYNRQFSIFVLGLEADFQGAAMDGRSQGSGIWIPGNNGPLAAEARQGVDTFGTVRARIGTTYFDPSLLAYVTGGFAYGITRQGVSFYDSDGDLGVFDTRHSMAGFTVGAGAEWMFAPGWSAKVEYLYTDLGTPGQMNVMEVMPGVPLFQNAHVIKTFNAVADRFHTVRFGVNYHFNLFSDPVAVVAKY